MLVNEGLLKKVRIEKSPVLAVYYNSISLIKEGFLQS